MRLSDAIALGRVTVGELQSGDLKHCALGMACMSVGLEEAMNTDDYHAISCYWPWLGKTMEVPGSGGERWKEAIEIVYQMFDDEVMGGTMTLDQLIDWVRSVEPEETPSLTEAVATQEAHAEVKK